MWKAAILLLTIYSCGINGGNINRNEWAHARTEPVSQPSYYSQYGPLLTDLASYQQKLNQQGFASAYEHDWSSPFTPANNAAPEYQAPIQYNYNQGSNDHQNVHSFYQKKVATYATKPPCTTTEKPTTTTHSDEHKGKHKFNIVVKTDKKNESEHAKKPTLEIDIKWPNIKHDSQTDKKHANSSIVQGLNGTLSKISDKVEVKVTAIKQFLDKSIGNINKTTDGVYQQISNESSKLIDRINKKLKSIEKQLEKLKFGAIKRIDDDFDDSFEDEEDADDDLTRVTAVKPKQKPNVVHSEIGKKLRSLELLDMDAELRGDLKTSISDAVKNAQERFNKLIDEQVAKINNKIADITYKFEAAFNKFQDAFAKLPRPTLMPRLKPNPTKVYTPPTNIQTSTAKPATTSTKKYTTLNWTPKATTPIPPFPTKFYDTFTTPDYFKYTLPTPKYKQKTFDSSETLIADLNRMDADVEALEIVDDANDESAKSDDDSLKTGAVQPPVRTVNQSDAKKKEEDENSEPISELKIEFDTAKSLDDLQSQVLENVKDTLKSDAEALEAIENNQSEALENAEDKLESDTVEKVIESVLTEELRNELKEEDKLIANDDENSNIDNSQAENLDDLAKQLDDVRKEEATTIQSFDDSEKSLKLDEDDVIEVDDNQMRSVENDAIPVDAFDGDEDSQLNQPNQAGSFRFDELEVIQLIPVIIEQLRRGHVSESEQEALAKIFGDLWSLLLVEAKRVEGEEMNPLLRTLIQSEEVRLAKREITKQIGNDIYKNSVRRVYRGNDERPKPYISLDDDRKLLSPSERLLKMVAAIVHKANLLERSEVKLRQKQKRRNMRKKNQKNPLGIVTVGKPRRRFMDRILSINRIKRSIIKYTSDLTDMKALLEQVNQSHSSEEDEIEESDSNEHQDDYLDDDYFYDDDNLMPSDDADLFNQFSANQMNYMDDYENGSVNEFIQLAKQRDRREESEKSQHSDDSYDDED